MCTIRDAKDGIRHHHQQRQNFTTSRTQTESARQFASDKALLLCISAIGRMLTRSFPSDCGRRCFDCVQNGVRYPLKPSSPRGRVAKGLELFMMQKQPDHGFSWTGTEATWVNSFWTNAFGCTLDILYGLTSPNTGVSLKVAGFVCQGPPSRGQDRVHYEASALYRVL